MVMMEKWLLSNVSELNTVNRDIHKCGAVNNIRPNTVNVFLYQYLSIYSLLCLFYLLVFFVQIDVQSLSRID